MTRWSLFLQTLSLLHHFLGLYSRFHKLSDKWRVRSYVAERVGSQYLNEVYQVASGALEVDLEALPKSFVVKATHDSGSLAIVEDKDTIDRAAFFAQLDRRLASTYGASKGEYWHEEIPPQLVFERRIVDKVYGTPGDYKFMAFHGRVELCLVELGRFVSHTRNLYTKDWRLVPVAYVYPRLPDANLERPARFDELVSVAESLADGFDFVRVDLYAPDDDSVVFGEMTFAPESGRGRFTPAAYDYELGSLW